MSSTRARLTVGEVVQGRERSLRVEGCLLFLLWDDEDRKFYTWEEWQLSGTHHGDTWVEVDHDDGAVFLYEPVHFAELLDPRTVVVGQHYTLVSGGIVYDARVTEVGRGTLDRILGRTTCRLKRGQQLDYADFVLTDAAGRRTAVTIDRLGRRGLLSYRKQRLKSAAQRRMFGKVISPPGVPRAVVLSALGLVTVVVAGAMPRGCDQERRCEEGEEDCAGTTRPVYGGGGGGVGK